MRSLSCSHRGSCFTWVWLFAKWRFMGLYLPLCKSGLSPLKSADVKIRVNKGGSRPGAVISALLFLFRLGFQICNCNIIFPVIWECELKLSWNKRMNRCRLALQSCSTVPRQVVVARFQLPVALSDLSQHCSRTPSFATAFPSRAAVITPLSITL